MGLAQGKKVDPAPLRLRRSRRSRPPARSSQRDAVWLARPNSILGRRRGGRRVSFTSGAAWQAKRKKPWRRKRQRRPPRLGHRVLLPALTGRQAGQQISPRMEEVQRPGRHRSCSCPADPEGHSSYQDELGQLNPSCSRPSATAVPNPTVDPYPPPARLPLPPPPPIPCPRR